MTITRNDKNAIGVGVVFLFVGLGLLGGGGYWAVRTERFIATAERADGRVIDLVAHSGDNGSTYAPVVTFIAKDGTERTFTSTTSSSPPSHQRGDAVRVLYEPGRPEKAEIDSFVDLWLGPLILGGMGLIFSLIGFGVSLGAFRAGVLRRRLRMNGQRIEAAVDGIERGAGSAVTGWTIVAKATDPRGIPRLFRSPLLSQDPGPRMTGRTTVTVIVDPDDYGTYDMDMAFLQG